MKKRAIAEPFWGGPEVGISSSRIAEYFTCPERFRITNILGIQEPDTFNIRIEYGQMWHAAEEAQSKVGYTSSRKVYRQAIEKYALELCKKYRLERDFILYWASICNIQFEEYLEFYSNDKDYLTRKPLYSEEKFKQTLILPSGRKVVLSGIWDLVDKVGGQVWLQDHKTKGQIMIEQLKKQLKFDIQTMLYMVALQTRHPEYNLAGFRYNVVRRPLAGGKHTIRQKKTESIPDFLGRVQATIKNDPTFFFERFTVEVSFHELERFKLECLYPVLENLLDDYEWWTWCLRNDISPYTYLFRQKKFPKHIRRHYRSPFGIRNTLADGGSTPLDYYLENGSMVGLEVKKR